LRIRKVSEQNPTVKFEVVGEIEKVEAIAAGPSVQVRGFLRKPTVAADGGNERESQPCGFRMAICGGWSYIGTRPKASANAT